MDDNDDATCQVPVFPTQRMGVQIQAAEGRNKNIPTDTNKHLHLKQK